MRNQAWIAGRIASAVGVLLTGSVASAAGGPLLPAFARAAIESQPEPPPETPPPEGTPPEVAPPEPGFFSGWAGAVDLGLNGSEGNSETFSARGGISGKRSTDTMETTVSLTYVYGTADGTKNKSRGELNARNDWRFGAECPWGFFATGRVEYDEFQDWDWRLSGFAGPSYLFIKDERTTLRGRVGVGAAYEIGGADNDVTPELDIGADLNHKLTERQQIFVTVDYYPSLSDFPDYRVDTKAGWEILVDPEVKMTLKLGLNDRYDSDPGAGRKRNDLEYFALLSWAF